MTVPHSNRPPRPPRILVDDWEAPKLNRPNGLRVAASIGTALIIASVAILNSARPWDRGDERAWIRPAAPPPYVVALDTPLVGTRVTPPSRPPLSTPPRRPPTQRVADLAGYLSINSSPWAELSVDGRAAGSTPQIRLRVTPGRHSLLLVREGFKPRSAWVDVGAGRTVRITNITLEKVVP